MEHPSLDELMAEWESKITPSPTLRLLVTQLYMQAGTASAAGCRTILTCLVRLQHLGQCKLPTEIAQAVASFHQ